MATAASHLRLRPLRLADESTVVAAHRRMKDDDDNFRFLIRFEPGRTDWPDYVAHVQSLAWASETADGWVPGAFLLAVVDDEIVGRSSIRFALDTEELRVEGGHLGYGVLRRHRRRGYATEILRQSLIIARSRGVERALVTCDDDNVGSATIIEACGGVLESTITASDGKQRRRYWID